LGVLYINIQKKHITELEAKEFLNNALKNGYRISPKLIEQFFESLEN
jgi:predicted nucleic acid-binding protein